MFVFVRNTILGTAVWVRIYSAREAGLEVRYRAKTYKQAEPLPRDMLFEYIVSTMAMDMTW